MKTTEELKALYEDAHKALEEAIDDGCRLRVSVPAEPDRDHDLRISAALNELPHVAEAREEVESRVGAILANVSNYPERAQTRMLGQDTAPLRKKIMEAIYGA